MNPTDVLKNEHRVIEKVLAVLEELAKKSAAEKTLNQKHAQDILDFLKNFADKCHHGKEETHLFRIMEDRGFPKDSGPVAVMLYEHDLGRGYIREMTAALNNVEKNPHEAFPAFYLSARQYVDLLRQHIMKEDLRLFPMAESAFDEADRQELLAAFEKVEKDEIGLEIHEKFHKLAEDLVEYYGVTVENLVPTSASCGFSCH